MAEILKIKTHTNGFLDFIAAGLVKKIITEPVIGRFAGNGNVLSGGIKGLLAYGSYKGLGEKANILTMALGIDAGEDVAIGAANMLRGQGLSLGNQEQAVW